MQDVVAAPVVSGLVAFGWPAGWDGWGSPLSGFSGLLAAPRFSGSSIIRQKPAAEQDAQSVGPADKAEKGCDEMVFQYWLVPAIGGAQSGSSACSFAGPSEHIGLWDGTLGISLAARPRACRCSQSPFPIGRVVQRMPWRVRCACVRMLVEAIWRPLSRLG